MAYTLCCEALQQTPTVRPGDTINNAELHDLVEAAARISPAGPLIRHLRKFGLLQMDGPWHTLPDLLSYLATPQGALDAFKSSLKAEGLLSVTADPAQSA